MVIDKDKLKDGLYTVFFMFAVTAVFILITSFIYINTRDQIKLNEKLRLQRAVLKAGNIKYEGGNRAEIQRKFEDVILLNENVYQIKNGDKKGRYVFIVTGSGLWGKIRAAIGLKSDLKTMTGIEFLKQNETPGLGARITETWFKEQFENKVAPIAKAVGENKEAGRKEFNAITGA